MILVTLERQFLPLNPRLRLRALLNGYRDSVLLKGVQLQSSTCQVRASALCLSRALGIAANDLDSVGMDVVRIVKLEVNIFNNEGPDFIAETVGV